MKEIGMALFFIGAVGILVMVTRWLFIINSTLGIIWTFLLMFFTGWLILSIELE